MTPGFGLPIREGEHEVPASIVGGELVLAPSVSIVDGDHEFIGLIFTRRTRSLGQRLTYSNQHHNNGVKNPRR
jgi:hypothetical protein